MWRPGKRPQVEPGVRSWCYPRACTLALPPSLAASCLPGEFGARRARLGLFSCSTGCSQRGRGSWLPPGCGFGSCRPRAPPQSGAQRPHRAGRSRGELTSRCSSAKEGAPNRSTARVVGLWQPSPALPASTEPGPTLRFCTCCLQMLLPGTGPCCAFQPNTGRGLGWKWESGFPL